MYNIKFLIGYGSFLKNATNNKSWIYELGDKILLQNANLQIKPGMIAGLIGKNGAGKSSLMKVLTGKLEPEKGEIIKPEAWKFAYLEQELPESDLSVIDFALTGDSEYKIINEELK